MHAVKAEKHILLADAFRIVLRAGYSHRPTLADEIQSYRYFHSAKFDKETGRRVDPEAQAADDALGVLRDATVNKLIRLRARLGDNLPADIDPMEVAWNGIRVFDNTLEVYGERGVTLRTYRHVHCYENEIKLISNNGSKRVGRRPGADWDVVRDALRLEINRRGMIGPDNDADWRIQADAERFVSAILEERNEAITESVVRTRVREMLKGIGAGN